MCTPVKIIKSMSSKLLNTEKKKSEKLYSPTAFTTYIQLKVEVPSSDL